MYMKFFARISNLLLSADITNYFKNRLDKFWINQDLLFDYNTRQN